MGKKFEDERYACEVAKSRHETINIITICITLFGILSMSIGGCTYYNVEKVKHPVKIESNTNTQIERK